MFQASASCLILLSPLLSLNHDSDELMYLDNPVPTVDNLTFEYPLTENRPLDEGSCPEHWTSDEVAVTLAGTQ